MVSRNLFPLLKVNSKAICPLPIFSLLFQEVALEINVIYSAKRQLPASMSSFAKEKEKVTTKTQIKITCPSMAITTNCHPSN